MNAFEDIVRRYFEAQHYWVRQSVKVEITKEQKTIIGTPSMPRPEIDLVALQVKNNELLLVEVKSLFDSPGVHFKSISDRDYRGADHYKLFTNDKFRETVTESLKNQYAESGLIGKKIKVNYCLAAGHVQNGHEELIAEYFQKKKWIFVTPQQIREFVEQCATKGWEDDVVTMTAKLLRKR